MSEVYSCIFDAVAVLVNQGSRVRPIWSHVRPNFSRVRLKKNVGRTGASSHSQKKKKKKKSPRLKVSAVRQQTR